MHFRTLLIGAMLVLAAPALAKTYTNDLFGITIERPDKWHTISTAQASRNASAVKAGPGVMEEALAEFERTSLFVFMKYPQNRPGINPTLKLSVHSLKGAQGVTDVQIAEIIAGQLKSAFPEFEMVEQPTVETIGNATGARYAVRFTLHANGRVYRVTSRAWVILRGNYFINLATSFETPKQGEELRQVAGTLVLQHE